MSLGIGVVFAIAIPAVTIGLRRLQPAAQSVERATVWPDTVKRGEILRPISAWKERTIELERLRNVLYAGQPVFGQTGSVVSLFKVGTDGKLDASRPGRTLV
jgi:hypothetical protein